MRAGTLSACGPATEVNQYTKFVPIPTVTATEKLAKPRASMTIKKFHEIPAATRTRSMAREANSNLATTKRKKKKISEHWGQYNLIRTSALEVTDARGTQLHASVSRTQPSLSRASYLHFDCTVSMICLRFPPQQAGQRPALAFPTADQARGLF